MRKRIYIKSEVSKECSSKREMSPTSDSEDRRREFLKLRAEKRRIRKEKRAEKNILKRGERSFCVLMVNLLDLLELENIMNLIV